MKFIPRFADTDRQLSVGIFLITIGGVVGILSYLMAIVPMVALGLGSFLIGIMVLYLPESRRSMAEKLTTDLSLPFLLNIESLLEDLDLDEKGIYIPASGLGASPKVFLPLTQTQATEHPPLALTRSHRIFVTVGKNPQDRGILLDPPGNLIVTAIERTLRVDLSKTSLNELGARLNSGFKALGIAETTSLEHQDNTVSIQMDLTDLVDLETKLRNLTPRLVAQVGTPVTSAVAAAVSKATGQYATFKKAVFDVPRRKISITLKLSA